MCMDKCVNCDDLVDTDAFPEVYRQEFDYKCICDDCIDEMSEEQVVSLEQHERKEDDPS